MWRVCVWVCVWRYIQLYSATWLDLVNNELECQEEPSWLIST
jgi:hypothetical protein